MSNEPNNPSPNPADLAADALRQAQNAVNDLRQNTNPAGGSSAQEPEMAAALAAAQEAIAAAKSENPAMGAKTGAAAGGSSAQPFDLPAFGAPGVQKKPEGIDLLSDVNLNVTIELGRTRMLVEDVLRLGEGSVVELDKLAGDPVDVYVNDRHVARGEVLVLNDNFCIRINEIVAPVSEGGPVNGKTAGRIK